MRRNLAFGGLTRSEPGRSVCSIACLAFVALLCVAFWAGALWIGQIAVRLSQGGF